MTTASVFYGILRFVASALAATVAATLLGTVVAVLAFVPPGQRLRLDGLFMFASMGGVFGFPSAVTMGAMMILLCAHLPKLQNAYMWAVAGMFGSMPVILITNVPSPFSFSHQMFMVAATLVGVVSALVFRWVWRGGRHPTS